MRISASWAPKLPNNNSKAAQRLKAMEARRVAHMKSVGQRLAKELKHTDTEARKLFVDDLQELQALVSEALLPQKDTAQPDTTQQDE